jgi:hypothetical protein
MTLVGDRDVFITNQQLVYMGKRVCCCTGIVGREGLHCLSEDESRRAYEASHLRRAN